MNFRSLISFPKRVSVGLYVGTSCLLDGSNSVLIAGRILVESSRK